MYFWSLVQFLAHGEHLIHAVEDSHRMEGEKYKSNREALIAKHTGYLLACIFQSKSEISHMYDEKEPQG
jgi:hypothetical protein